MKTIKKGWLALLLLMLTAALLGGCSRVGKDHGEDSIFTGKSDALRILVRNNEGYAEQLTKQFPDIDFDFYYYGGLNTSMALNYLVNQDDLGDISITTLQLTDEIAEKHLLDLSGSEICGRYEASILSQFDVDGKIYQLPGYVTMRNILYNKDMFEKYGWEEPENFEEMVELCRRIREDAPEITPIVMGGAANGYYFTTMSSYAQAEFLYTPEGQKWMKAYQRGEAKAKAEEGFGEGIRMTQELIDAGAFDYEANVGMWDAELFEKRMRTEEAAMMFVWGGQAYISEQISPNNEIEFGMLPFRNRSGQEFIGTNIPFYIGLSKELGEKGNEKKLEQAMRVIGWLSTEEGIDALSKETLSSILPLKGAEHTAVLDVNRDFWNDHLDSIKAPMLYSGYEDILAPVADVIVEAVKGNGDLSGLTDYIDEIHGKFLKGGDAAIQVGEFAENFTHEETVQTMAHILHSKGDSDITLVSDGDYQNGILNNGGVFLRFCKGPVIEDQMTIWIPGSNAMGAMVQMKLTGSEVKALLENGKRRVLLAGETNALRAESHPEAVAEASFDYYGAGMTAEWKQDKISSITLENGKVLEDDQVYTVAFAADDFTEEAAALGKPVELPYTSKDVFEEYLSKHSPVSPIKPERRR